MKSISLDIKGIAPYVSKEEQELLEQKAYEAHDMLENKSGMGRNMLGWLKLPENRNDEEIDRIKNAADRIKKTSRCIYRCWNWWIIFRCKSCNRFI